MEVSGWLLSTVHFPFWGKEGPVPIAQEAGLIHSQSRHGGEENLNLIIYV
jgi:hypothetical protein